MLSVLTLFPTRVLPRSRSVPDTTVTLKKLQDILEKSREVQGRRATAADEATAQEEGTRSPGGRTVGRNIAEVSDAGQPQKDANTDEVDDRGRDRQGQPTTRAKYHKHTIHRTPDQRIPPALICATRRLAHDASARSPDSSSQHAFDTADARPPDRSVVLVLCRFQSFLPLLSSLDTPRITLSARPSCLGRS